LKYLSLQVFNKSIQFSFHLQLILLTMDNHYLRQVYFMSKCCVDRGEYIPALSQEIKNIMIQWI